VTSTTTAGRRRRAVVDDGDVGGWGAGANANAVDVHDDENDGDEVTIEGMATTETNPATSPNVAAVILLEVELGRCTKKSVEGRGAREVRT
jgi:hypothetical protein